MAKRKKNRESKRMTTVEAEKAEAMRRYNNRISFRNILRAAVVASLCCLWFPTVMSSLQAAGDWFYRTGAVFITDRSVVFIFANILVALIFVLSCDNNNETSSSDTEPDLYDQYTSSSNNNESVSSDTEPDLYDQYTSYSTVIVTASAEEKVEDDDSNKQIVPAFIVAGRDAVTKGIYRRTKSEMKKERIRPVMEIRRTESAKVVAMERLSSEEFRLKVETFIMEKKRSLVQENDVVQYHEPGLVGAASSGSGYGSC